MDSLTHIAIGICTGELVAGKKIGRKAMLWGAVANNLPDIDVTANLWLNHVDSLLAHRGFTHSLLCQILLIPTLAWLLKKLHPRLDFSFTGWMTLIGSGLFLHIFLDAFTAYGTGWFEPFSHYRVSFNTLFILDPIFSAAFIIGAIVLLVMKAKNPLRHRMAVIFTSVAAAYFLFAMVNKIRVNEIVERTLARNHISNENYFTTPTPLNNFLWYIVAKDSNGIHLGYYSVFDKTDQIQYTNIIRNASIPDSLKDDEHVRKLLRFSQGYYLIEHDTDGVVFSDLRMGQRSGWADPTSPFVFRYLISGEANSAMMIQRGRMGSFEEGALRKLWIRIKGI